MEFRKIILNNRIAYTGYGFRCTGTFPAQGLTSDAGGCGNEEIRRAVQKAIASLSDDERELIIRYYFMGKSCSGLSPNAAIRPPGIDSQQSSPPRA